MSGSEDLLDGLAQIDLLVEQLGRDLLMSDLDCKTFSYSGLADAWFTKQNWIVLTAAI